MNNSNIYTLEQVAAKAGVSYKTIKRWYVAGKVPSPNRDRNNRPAFTERKLRAILRYAFQLKPASQSRRVVRATAGRSA